MKKNRLLIIMCLLICGSLSAQKLPKECTVLYPEYIAIRNKVQPDWTKSQKWQDWAVDKIKRGDFGKQIPMVWIVYSDRDNNKTYTRPDTSSAVHSNSPLKFRDQFYVADIKNGFALLYQSNYSGKEISKDAKCFGWIPVDNLLLWKECPQTHSKIYQKALMVHDPEKGGSNAEKNPPFYMEPDITAAVNPNQRAKNLDIYFIMKTVKVGNAKYYLVSRSMLIHGKEQTVYGWMPEEYITEWNDRLLLEPTYVSEVVDYYKSKEVYPAIFNDMNDARQLWTNEEIKNLLWHHRGFSTQRMHEQIMRNPIVAKGEVASDIYSVASVSSVSAQEIDPALLKKIEELKQATDNINVIFVIDATPSMKEYFSSVVFALKTIMKREYKHPMKAGVVLYKDYNDTDRISIHKLTPNIKDVFDFVALKQESIGKYEDDDYTAMFLGLETALDARTMGYEEKHTNFIILIGDAANRRTDPNGVEWLKHVENLSQKMFNNRINFIAYQVNDAGSNAYGDFPIQIGKLQTELVKKLKNKMQSEELEYKLDTNRFYLLERKSSSVELPVYNTYKFATSGESETIEGLQKIIVDNISDFHNFVYDQLTLLEANHATSGTLVVEKLQEILRLNHWTDTEISKYIAYLLDGGSTKFIGYAPIKTDKAPKQYQLFDYVLFFSQTELEDIIQQLDKINASDAGSDAKAFQDAIVKMGQAMLGQLNEDEIRDMDMDKLLGQIYGITVPLTLCGLDIKKIPNMDKEDLKDYIRVFKDKLQQLKRINSDSNYDGRFQRNKITYYWIPMDAMPGVYEDCKELRIRN